MTVTLAGNDSYAPSPTHQRNSILVHLFYASEHDTVKPANGLHPRFLAFTTFWWRLLALEYDSDCSFASPVQSDQPYKPSFFACLTASATSRACVDRLTGDWVESYCRPLLEGGDSIVVKTWKSCGVMVSGLGVGGCEGLVGRRVSGSVVNCG